MYIITGYDGFIAKNFLKHTTIKKKQIIKIKRNVQKLRKIKNREITIINFAALYQKKTQSKDIHRVIDANLTYPTKIIQTLIEQKKKITFFNISSYFQLKKNFKNKSNFYSATKNAFIEILLYFKKKNKLKFFNIYLYDVFGHEDKREKIFNSIIKSYNKKKLLKIENPNNKIAPIFISDVSKIINEYIRDKKKIKEIHINCGKIITVQKLIDLAKSVLKRLKVSIANNKNKDFLKIYKMKKYKVEQDLDDTIKKFFEKYV